MTTSSRLTAFPPVHISGFLELCAGHWLSLRSVMEPEGEGEWHASQRGELHVVFVAPEQADGCGELTIHLPDQSTTRLQFHTDHTLRVNTVPGRWVLCGDGSLEMEVKQGNKVVRERIWFSKPNLRLRCTLEESSDGAPGRASFSSEIRRVQRPA